MEIAYTIAGIVKLMCLSTSRIKGVTRRPHVVAACIESDVTVTVSNATARLVTEKCYRGACICTCGNSIGAACIHNVPARVGAWEIVADCCSQALTVGFAYTIAGFVNLICLSTSPIIGAD